WEFYLTPDIDIAAVGDDTLSTGEAFGMIITSSGVFRARRIEAGLLKRFPMEAVFGMHNIPGIPLGEFAVKPGPMMAGYDIFEIKVKGTGGHAAFPQVTNDAIVAAASLVNALQTVVSRIIDPLLPAVLSVTAIQAGTNFNILPETATINGTVRYFDPDVQNLIEARLRSITKQILAAHGCDATVNYERRYPATINSAAEAEFSAGVLSRIFGNDKVNRNPTPMMGSEDFAFMLGEIPGCYIWAGNGAGKGSCMIHNPEYDFNDELIPYGATYWVELVREYLRQDPA
ncbi:MAG: amidohydrolase, partial [Gammaproteobacteria bacterium]